MRLLSLLSEIERAILMEANAAEGAVWSCARIVNFQNGLARLTLVRQPDADNAMPEGAVLVQNFDLANGSFCVKAHLQWSGHTSTSTIAVYDLPTLNWKMEASRIASAWLAGPPAEPMASADEISSSGQNPLAAAS
jgi:hypothetical protein